MRASLPAKLFPEPTAARFLIQTCLQTAAVQTGVLLGRTTEKGRSVTFRIFPDSYQGWTWLTEKHPLRSPRGKLRSTSRVPYQLIRQTLRGTTRRVNAVCWHGHRDFMTRLFDLLPNLKLETAKATYRGRNGFLDLYQATAHRNIGSKFQPLYYNSACNCHLR